MQQNGKASASSTKLTNSNINLDQLKNLNPPVNSIKCCTLGVIYEINALPKCFF